MAITKELRAYIDPNQIKYSHDLRVGITDNECIFFTVTDVSTGKPEHHEIIFNSKWIPEEHLEWFAGVLGRQLYEFFLEAQRCKREFINQKYGEFKDALGKDFLAPH